MFYRNKGHAKSTKKSARTTRYGNPINQGGDAMISANVTKKVNGVPAKDVKGAVKALTSPTPNTKSYLPKFKPVSDEVTVYGAKKFRTPYSKDEYFGTQGSPIPAYVFDIDGTLMGYGSGADKKALDWAEKLYKKNPKAVFLVITARDHGSFGYESSFNWLMKHFPYPFIGPFARPVDDPRYASEFKRELAQGFEDIGLYQILGAADDNSFVIDMWKQWAIDHFEDPKDFDLLECSYSSYSGWRKDLPSKGSPYTSSYGAYGTGNYSKDEHWDKDVSKWVANTRDGERWVSSKTVDGIYKPGYWEKDASAKAPKNQPNSWGTDPTDKKWKKVSEFISEQGSIADDPAWRSYFEARGNKGAYLAPEIIEGEVTDEELNEILARVDHLNDGYSLYRADLEEMVRHDFPGYSDKELADMSLDDLRENAGITNNSFGKQDRVDYESVYLDEQVPLFSNEQLGLPENRVLDLDERRALVEYRLDMEEDVYASYGDLTNLEVQNMSFEELETKWSTAYADLQSQDAPPTVEMEPFPDDEVTEDPQKVNEFINREQGVA